jgi:hypothetical protein
LLKPRQRRRRGIFRRPPPLTTFNAITIFQTKGVGARVAELLRRPCAKTLSHQSMKTSNNIKSAHNVSSPSGFRASGARANAAKTFEHRYERRKIREQLRRLDLALNTDD